MANCVSQRGNHSWALCIDSVVHQMDQTSAPLALKFSIFFCSGLENGLEMLMPNAWTAYATLLKASFFVKLVVTCSSTQSESHTA
ncbi:hypothetical protein MKX08_003671 [Trichoderma sp. CBMAI-0020]|nr:hypothetical protein MKX08_003671 [Trichoderma sp. CBMAI-0020]